VHPIPAQMGEQAAGVCFAAHDKVEIATRLAALAPIGGPGLRLVPRPGGSPTTFATTEASQCA